MRRAQDASAEAMLAAVTARAAASPSAVLNPRIDPSAPQGRKGDIPTATLSPTTGSRPARSIAPVERTRCFAHAQQIAFKIGCLTGNRVRKINSKCE
ncbi:hypothetical protein MEX01_02640 [Methylorubrum extorquens]|nr:hypothetical protein MEX01_02640 [Methylorubrum extorquens]